MERLLVQFEADVSAAYIFRLDRGRMVVKLTGENVNWGAVKRWAHAHCLSGVSIYNEEDDAWEDFWDYSSGAEYQKAEVIITAIRRLKKKKRFCVHRNAKSQKLLFVINARGVAYVCTDICEAADGGVSVLCPDGTTREDNDAMHWDFETSGVYNVIQSYLETVCGLSSDVDEFDPDGVIGGIVTGRNCEYLLTVDIINLSSTLTTRDSPGQALLRKYIESLPDYLGREKADALEIINR